MKANIHPTSVRLNNHAIYGCAAYGHSEDWRTKSINTLWITYECNVQGKQIAWGRNNLNIKFAYNGAAVLTSASLTVVKKV